MKTAEEIKADIREMESTERWKLVTEISDFANSNNKERSDLLIELQEELTKIKRDIEFLSKKIGLHDMYINRIF